MAKKDRVKEYELSRIECQLYTIGWDHFPTLEEHELSLVYWDSRGIIRFHCKPCKKNHDIYLTQEEKDLLSRVNQIDIDRPYTL